MDSAEGTGGGSFPSTWSHPPSQITPHILKSIFCERKRKLGHVRESQEEEKEKSSTVEATSKMWATERVGRGDALSLAIAKDQDIC